MPLVLPPGDPNPTPKFFVVGVLPPPTLRDRSNRGRDKSNRGTSGIAPPPPKTFFECPLSLVDLLSPALPFVVNGLVGPDLGIEGEGGLCDINSAAPLKL